MHIAIQILGSEGIMMWLVTLCGILRLECLNDEIHKRNTTCSVHICYSKRQALEWIGRVTFSSLAEMYSGKLCADVQCCIYRNSYLYSLIKKSPRIFVLTHHLKEKNSPQLPGEEPECELQVI